MPMQFLKNIRLIYLSILTRENISWGRSLCQKIWTRGRRLISDLSPWCESGPPSVVINCCNCIVFHYVDWMRPCAAWMVFISLSTLNYCTYYAMLANHVNEYFLCLDLWLGRVHILRSQNYRYLISTTSLWSEYSYFTIEIICESYLLVIT